MIIDIISDLHGSFPKLDGGDLLILAGDYTARHTADEYLIFVEWLQEQNYREKIFIGGNHDTPIFKGELYFSHEWIGATWLNDSSCEYEGLKIWGSPWTAWFEGINPRCKAWALTGDEKLAKKWAMIPDDIDILITHSPPYGIMDVCLKDDKYESVGSKSLLTKVRAVKPKLHIFGHIHEGYGQIELDGTTFINASLMNKYYKPTNKPVRVEI